MDHHANANDSYAFQSNISLDWGNGEYPHEHDALDAFDLTSFPLLDPANLDLLSHSTCVDPRTTTMPRLHASHDDSRIRATAPLASYQIQAPRQTYPSYSANPPYGPTANYPFQEMQYNPPLSWAEAANTMGVRASMTGTHMPDTHIPSAHMPGARQQFGHLTHQQFDQYLRESGPAPSLQNATADDCASVNCSQTPCRIPGCPDDICEDEECTGEGTQCDDIQCNAIRCRPADNSHDGAVEQKWTGVQTWDPACEDFDMSMGNYQCNHTDTEHVVAKTLQNLSAPANPAQSNYPCFLEPPTHHDPSGDDALPSPIEDTPSLIEDRPENSLESPRPSISRDSSDTAAGEAEEAEIFQCRWMTGGEICRQPFPNSFTLQNHIYEDHVSPLNSETKYQCQWNGCNRCERGENKEFASRNKLRRHIATHTFYKPFKCEECGLGFSAQQALDQHRRTHTGETPYRCDVLDCGKAFKQKSALTMHKRTHTGEKPLYCPLCGKKFGESSNLSKHRKTHNPDPKFKCSHPGCTKAFIRADQLRRHEAKHSQPGGESQTGGESQPGGEGQKSRPRTQGIHAAPVVGSDNQQYALPLNEDLCMSDMGDQADSQGSLGIGGEKHF